MKTKVISSISVVVLALVLSIYTFGVNNAADAGTQTFSTPSSGGTIDLTTSTNYNVTWSDAAVKLQVSFSENFNSGMLYDGSVSGGSQVVDMSSASQDQAIYLRLYDEGNQVIQSIHAFADLGE